MFDLNQSITEWRRQMAVGRELNISQSARRVGEPFARGCGAANSNPGATARAGFSGRAARQIGVADELKTRIRQDQPAPASNESYPRYALACGWHGGCSYFLVEGVDFARVSMPRRVDRILGMAFLVFLSLPATSDSFPILNRTATGSAWVGRSGRQS